MKASKRRNEAVWGWLMLGPMALLTALFVVYPIADSMRIAFYNWDGPGQGAQFVGWRHFFGVAQDPWFWNALKNTFIYTGLLVPIQLFLALLLALLLNDPRLKGKTIFRAIFFAPVVTSAAVLGIVISLLAGNFGGDLADLLKHFGLNLNPYVLADPKMALYAVVAVGIWHTLGYNLIYFLAALQGIPPELYEAAKIDGADPVQAFIHITLPSLRSVGAVIVMLSVLGSLAVFDLVLTLTGGGPYFSSDVVSTYIYSYAFSSSHGTSSANVGFASAASVFMGFIIMGLSLAQYLVLRRLRQKESA